MELKKDPGLLALAAVCVACLTVAMVMGKITWAEMLAGVALLGLPSVFGTAKPPEAKP